MKHLLLSFLALFLCLAGGTAHGQELTNDVIKIKVNKKAGEQIMLYMETEGDITIQGVSNGSDFKPGWEIYYTLTSAEVEVKGSVKRFKCIDNKVISFDAHDHPTLADVELQKNEITQLTLENCPNVFWLNFGDNQVSDYNISKLPKLETLFFKNNQVKKIDLSQFPLLHKVICENNLIDEKNMEEMVKGIADRTGQNAMGLFYATYPAIQDKNVLTAVSSAILKGKNWQPYIREGNLWVYDPGRDVDDAVILATNKVRGDKVTLKITGKDMPEFFGISNPESFVNGEDITYDVSSPWIVVRGELTAFESIKNGVVSANVATHATMESFKVHDDVTEKIDLRDCKSLKTLSCDNNRITDLILKGTVQLAELSCKGNRMVSLDLSEHAALQKVDCSQNILSSLNVNNLPKLTQLYCSENQLRGKELDGVIDNLPKYEGEQKGSLYVLNSDADEKVERNQCNDNQVKALREKGWKVFHYSEGQWVEYKGSDPVKPTFVRMTTSRDKGGWLLLLIKAYGNVTITGVTDPEKFVNDEACLYTLDGSMVTIEGDIQYIDCSNNELTFLEFADGSLLENISCYDNNLDRLVVTNCPALVNVVCEKNKIQAADMQLLIEGLPDRTSSSRGSLHVYNSTSYKEYNQCTKEQVELLHRKNWEAYHSVDGDILVYEGITLSVQDLTEASVRVNVGQSLIKISDAPAHALVELYDVSGQRLRTLRSNSTGNAEIDVHGLPRSNYVLRVDNKAYKIIL
ncbi:MAG: hypothetical protein SPI30_08310 [Prevotella sp.]|nr:hypothetical protein [Prevotella sp.]